MEKTSHEIKNKGVCEMNRSDFLEKDLVNATKHYKCCLDCLHRTEIEMADGNFEMAEKRIEDLQRSLYELKRLKERKQRFDQMKEIAKELKCQRIDIEKIARII